ncbi:MAG: virulence RhuM family protein [Methanothrix sp.]|nr:virulence RhuM family protein [Methanothrix sp.]
MKKPTSEENEMTADKATPAPDTGIIFYQTEDGGSRIQVRLQDGTVWLSQRLLAELYQVAVHTINEHISAIYGDHELSQEATIRKYRIVQTEGIRQVERQVDFYNLDMILAIGYRVRSHRGVQFRRWATERLKEYIIKGFVMDDERLKGERAFGSDYFDELLERIRDIRASEKRFYQKVRDIYTISVDYDSKAESTQEFFKIVQNKLHWAITGQTDAELISGRADAGQLNMGLTSWKGTRVRQADVVVAKNYLQQGEIGQLNRLVNMWLDYAEDQAEQRKPVYMKEWREKLDAFLQFNQRAILQHSGRTSMEEAKRLALEQYRIFNQSRIEAEDDGAESEFEIEVERLLPMNRNKTGE